MASNQHPEAAQQTSDVAPSLQNDINHNTTAQVESQAFFANHYSSPNEEAQEPSNPTHDQAQQIALLLFINDASTSTETLPATPGVQYPLDFHLCAPTSANAVAVVHSAESNSPIHVFIPAAHPPLAHNEFFVVPEHGDVANPGIHFFREVSAEGPVSWQVSPGLQIVPVDLQKIDPASGQLIIEGRKATFYASDTTIKDLIRQMHAETDHSAQEQSAEQPLVHISNFILASLDTGEEEFDNIPHNSIVSSLTPAMQQAMAFFRAAYLPPRTHSLQDVLRFVDTLPRIEIDELDDESRECSICRGPYGEPGSFDGGKVEKPVRVPCGLVFGNGCLKVLLSPDIVGEESGWGEILCPLCRRVIEGIGASV